MASDNFPTSTAGLAPSVETPVVELSDGDELDLTIAPVTKEIDGDTLRMLAYNGSIPGPTLKVRQNSEIVVNVRNEGDLEATVHWHGLRLDNRYDGTHETQAPIPVGGSFTYRIEFPDPGLYWYHPHIREDYGQELGLYGNIVVEPADEDYWPPAHREVVLTLDDILIEDGHVAEFSHSGPSHVAMGRFGTTMLVGGETEVALEAKRGEVVRFFLTNTANTRVFRVGSAGAKMKLVGGDSGRVEREELVEDVILAPSERVVVDVQFDAEREAALEHRTPETTYRLASVTVSEDEVEPLDFETLRENADLAAERERIAPYLEAAPDKTLSLVAEMDMGGAVEGETGVFACPMHAEIVATWEGKCPKCGMKLIPAAPDVAAPTEYACPMHPEITATWAGECPKCGMTLRPTGSGGHEEHEHHHQDEHAHAHDAVGRHRVGGRHGRGQPRDDAGEHALAHRRQEHRRPGARDRLAVPRRRPGEDPDRQREGLRPSDAPPVPHPRGGPLPRPQPRRHHRAQPRLEGHGAASDRRDRGHPARRDESRHLDGALPHRRAPRERDDVHLHRRAVAQARAANVGS